MLPASAKHTLTAAFDDPARTCLPTIVTRRTPYRVTAGRIITEALEIPVTHHCNLTCRSCSHLSPVSHKTSVDPDELTRDLSVLSRYYQPLNDRLLGDYPL